MIKNSRLKKGEINYIAKNTSIFHLKLGNSDKLSYFMTFMVHRFITHTIVTVDV